jgi:hypothetical protein
MDTQLARTAQSRRQAPRRARCTLLALIDRLRAATFPIKVLTAHCSACEAHAHRCRRARRRQVAMPVSKTRDGCQTNSMCF